MYNERKFSTNEMRFNTGKIQVYVIKVDNYSTFTSLEAHKDEDTDVALSYDLRKSLDRYPPCRY